MCFPSDNESRLTDVSGEDSPILDCRSDNGAQRLLRLPSLESVLCQFPTPLSTKCAFLYIPIL